MKRLSLLRHAKSSWEASGLADHDRPLERRGERAALVMGRYIAQQSLVPDLVLCSTAVRATETRALVVSQWPGEPPTDYDRGLYLSGVAAIRRRVSQVDDGVGHVLVIGHNPDLQDLTLTLAAGNHAPLRRKAEQKFPTAALAVMHFSFDRWSALMKSQGTLCVVAAPRDLV